MDIVSQIAQNVFHVKGTEYIVLFLVTVHKHILYLLEGKSLHK